MEYCTHCKLEIRGSRGECPLCKNQLPADESGAEAAFPQVPLKYENNILIRMLAFSSVIALVLSFVIHILLPTTVNWPIFMLLGLASMWLIILLLLWKRHNLTKNIVWFVGLAAGLSLFWDWRTDWRGWSLEYVIPAVCVAANLAMYVSAKLLRLSVRDYILYFMLGALFGIVPLLFIYLDWVNVIYPSVISVGVNIIFLSAILIFQGGNIKSELSKKMHL